MKMRKCIKKPIPSSLFRLKSSIRSRVEFHRISAISCDTNSLASVSQLNLDEMFYSKEYDKEWEDVEKEVSLLSIADQTGGVTPGDRRAIYYLVRYLRPKSVLEIGTHIGASTVHIAVALRRLKSLDRETSFRFITVDIRNVNDVVSKPWLSFGSTYSPLDMIKKLRCDDFVSFITESSINYFAKCEQKYDLIFLDGEHYASIVYQEIPAALKVLNKGGYILLHDYFPNLKPLWSNGALIPGPCSATQRLQAEGADIKVLPLGRLPWPTKLDSNVTSLALLGKN